MFLYGHTHTTTHIHELSCAHTDPHTQAAQGQDHEHTHRLHRGKIINTLTGCTWQDHKHTHRLHMGKIMNTLTGCTGAGSSGRARCCRTLPSGSRSATCWAPVYACMRVFVHVCVLVHVCACVCVCVCVGMSVCRHAYVYACDCVCVCVCVCVGMSVCRHAYVYGFRFYG